MRNPAPMNMNANIERALQYHQSDDLEQAAAIYKALLQNHPNHPDLLHLLGILAHQKNDGTKAQMFLNRAIQIKPTNPFYYCSLADVLIERGLPDEAIAHYQKSLQLKPDFDIAYYNLGNTFTHTGDFQSAISCYRQALAINPNLAEAHYNLAHVFQKVEADDKAVDHYRSALQLNPDHFDTHFHLANLLLDRGRLEEAVSHYQNALKLNPNHADAHNNLGRTLNDLGKFKQAGIYFQNAVSLKPEFAEAHFNLGTAFKNQKKIEAAIACYKKSLKLKPTLVIAYQALGKLLQDKGNYDAATSMYKEALKIKPDLPGVYYNLGHIARDQGRLQDAADDFKKALELKPSFAEAYNNLGVVHKDQDRLREAVECYQKALNLQPDLVEAHFNMGVVHQLRGRYREGLKAYRQALEFDPDYAPAKWRYYLSLPILYDTAEEIITYRNRFADNLDTLIGETKLDTPEDKITALKGIGSTTNFYLQYQGLNDSALQKTYGGFVCRVMAANYPQWSEPVSRPASEPRKKIRLGYVSSFMYAHTVGVFLMGWLKNQNRVEFEIFCYHIGNKTDAMTEMFKQQSDHFYQIGGRVEAAAKQIASDRLDILVFTDIGMNAPATQLAGLRLATVQCKGWGHPITTGLPTIDYYLSSDLMEPQNAQNHYSEKLIRLPNLALAYKKPGIPEDPKPRTEFGIKKDAFVYLISQSLFKLLPQYDAVYPRIGLKVPDAQFVFISHRDPHISKRFKCRLSRAFGEFGLSFDESCVFLPRLNHPDFLALNCVCDVLLDTFAWSGGKTTLEGISCGLPVVTCPGKFMRGRHAFAMLTIMGLTETIAASKSDYIDIAARLGLDKQYYGNIKRRIRENQTKLYDDRTCVTALEEFYRSAIRNDPQNPFYYIRPGDALKAQSHQNRAIICHQKAIEANPDTFEAYIKLGMLYHRQKNFNGAIRCYLKAAQIKPDFVEVHYGAGLAYQALDKLDDAIASYDKVIRLNPAYAEAHNNKGKIYKHKGDLAKALACFQQAAELKPDSAEAYFNLGDTLCALGQMEAAIENFNQALRCRPDMFEAHNNLGNALKAQGNLEAAVESYRQAVRLNPDLAEVYYNLGNALRLKEAFEDAITNFRQALQLKPHYAEAFNNLGLVYKNQGYLNQATENFSQALRVNPDLAEAHWNRAFTYLLKGNFEDGWKDYDWRFQQAKWQTLYPHRYSGPRWNGSNCEGKTIFVHDEQGLGDTLQFVRYLPTTKARCGKIIFETRKELIDLLQGFPGIDTLVIRSSQPAATENWDFYIPLLSLPKVFSTTLKTIPSHVPYIYADSKKVEYWKHRLIGNGFKVGIVWAGRPMHSDDRNRSCALKQFLSLSGIHGIQLIGLQKGEAVKQVNDVGTETGIVNLGKEFEDFTDTAGVIQNLDLVISVDTAVAHLAGAMGKAVWVLLPFIPDWRWMMNRDDSPWYPTMRLFRQKARGDWESVFERVETELRMLVEHSAEKDFD